MAHTPRWMIVVACGALLLATPDAAATAAAAADTPATVDETERPPGAGCPPMCLCELRPWFTPQSTYREALTVDCNDQRLARVPPGVAADSEVLLLQGNTITSIAREQLAPLRNLTDLDLSQNNFTSVADVGLLNVSRLLTLHLEENRVTELADGCLSILPSLQELYLNHNRISSVAPDAFAGLGGLLRLHLNSNRLRAIDRRWFEATPHLEVLMIGENPIVGVAPANFRPLANLRSLVLAGTGLAHVPGEALLGLEKLESLSLYDNLLEAVPRAALRHLPALKFLDLNKNPVRQIRDGDFRDMLNLKELGVSSMAELVSIERMALVNLPVLTKLEATNNPKLAFVHRDAFDRLPRLESLMLNDDGLGALHRATVRSLRSLREISLHGNPLRCDCVNRWMGAGNRGAVRFLEPESMRCAAPPELEGRRVRDVAFAETADSCLPLIAAGTFPARLNVPSGARVRLACRAIAEPEADIYWVTPRGDKVAPAASRSDAPLVKYQLGPEGTLEVAAIAVEEAGLYTCVAHNSEGADTRTVAVRVDGALPASVARDGLRLEVRRIDPRSILVAWKFGGGRGEAVRSGGGGGGGGALSSDLRWSSATVRVDNTRVTYTARVPLGVHEYNLTHLQPATPYEVCLSVGGGGGGGAPRQRGRSSERSCVNVSTAEAAAASAAEREAGAALAGGAACLFAVAGLAAAAAACAARRGGAGRHRRRRAYEPPSLGRCVHRASSIPLDELYPPLIGLWEPDGERDKEAREGRAPARVDTSRSGLHVW
ncbi:leucine-rich repeat neuronal protein 1-like [Petromyzon marinus]|uniref:leucine-rich repeat neuronal protein 1-like n=1 Tax=Petromyzon marinus TaxID=7757 RepID=UPI003F6FB967